MKTFEEFDAEVGKRKTGYYGLRIDMYTKRTGSKERVFRIKWEERNVKYPTHKDFLKAEKMARICNDRMPYEWVTQQELFPYTPEGLEAAIAFAQSDELAKRKAEYEEDWKKGHEEYMREFRKSQEQ